MYQVYVLRDRRDRYDGRIPGLERLYEDDEIELTFLPDRDYDTLEPEDLEGANAIYSISDNITAESLEGIDSIDVVVRGGAGFDNVDVPACTERGIIVCHAPQGPTESVAQGTLGMLITCAHNFKTFDRLLREDPNGTFANRNDHLGRELQAMTLGIVGVGQIGKRLIELLEPFDVEIQAHDPYLSEAEAAKLGIEAVGFDEVLETSDYVSLHVPLTEETRGMLGEEEFRKMKDTAYLLNTTRGGIYEDEVLAKALREEWIAGAAIDVFEDEPFVEGNPLLEFEDVLLTPHVSGVTQDSRRRICELVAESIVRSKDGELPINIINPDAVDEEIPEENLSPAYIPD